MAYRFAEIAFTPRVRALQESHGSRRQYQRLEEQEERVRPAGDRLSEAETAFLAERDHFFMASVGESGWPYVQHRGGPRGFLKAIDEKTLAFADFAGNKQYVSAGNLQHDSRVALILFDWARRRRLKILGRARIATPDEEPALAARLIEPGYPGRTERLFVIALEAFDWNCPQHITPRFSEAEISEAFVEVDRRLAALVAENEALKAKLAAAERMETP